MPLWLWIALGVGAAVVGGLLWVAVWMADHWETG